MNISSSVSFRSKVDQLSERTRSFAKDVRIFVRSLSKDMATIEDAKQLIRSSGSIGANYLEADESISKKDFIHRLKICRKEARESMYWLQLLEVHATNHIREQERLLQEAKQLLLIFHASISKAQANLQKSIASKKNGSLIPR